MSSIRAALAVLDNQTLQVAVGPPTVGRLLEINVRSGRVTLLAGTGAETLPSHIRRLVTGDRPTRPHLARWRQWRSTGKEIRTWPTFSTTPSGGSMPIRE